MNKHLQTPRKQSLVEFVDKVAVKWRLFTQPNTPTTADGNVSTEHILRDLVAMPTVSSNREANKEALDYIDHFLSSRGLYVRRLEWNGIESLVATTRRTKTPTVFLAGHIDVVPAAPTAFQLRAVGDRYYGRGVLDMKAAIAAYLSVVQDMQDTLHNYNFGIMITTDEEVGGFDGAKRLTEAGYLPKVLVLLDGGANWNLEHTSKGLWHVTLETHGKAAHGSRPWEGENAIDTLIAVIQEVKALFPKPHPDKSTINVGMVQGGKTFNQIPASASVGLDIRFASPEDQEKIHKAIKAICKRSDTTILSEIEADVVRNDPEHPHLQAFAAHTRTVIGRKPSWIASLAAHDGRYFAAHGVPCAVTYPEGGNHHGPDEWISKASLVQMQTLLREYVIDIARAPARPAKHPTRQTH